MKIFNCSFLFRLLYLCDSSQYNVNHVNSLHMLIIGKEQNRICNYSIVISKIQLYLFATWKNKNLRTFALISYTVAFLKT